MKNYCLEFELILRFDRYIWPIIQKSSDMYEIIVTRTPCFFERLKNNNNQQFLSHLGEIESLSKRQVFDLKIRSSYGGNMDVFYLIKNIEFVVQIIGMNSSNGNIIEDFGNLPIKNDKIALIKKYLSKNTNHKLITFGHDADVMYMFGTGDATEELKKLVT